MKPQEFTLLIAAIVAIALLFELLRPMLPFTSTLRDGRTALNNYQLMHQHLLGMLGAEDHVEAGGIIGGLHAAQMKLEAIEREPQSLGYLVKGDMYVTNYGPLPETVPDADDPPIVVDVEMHLQWDTLARALGATTNLDDMLLQVDRLKVAEAAHADAYADVSARRASMAQVHSYLRLATECGPDQGQTWEGQVIAMVKALEADRDGWKRRALEEFNRPQADVSRETSALPPRDESKPATEQGLFEKFIVTRTDGSERDADYFVLDVTHDQHAGPALAAYADAVEASHPKLASDMRKHYGIAAGVSRETDPWRELYAPEKLARGPQGAMHPDLPTWDDDREESIWPLLKAQGFEIMTIQGEETEGGGFTEEALMAGGDAYWEAIRAWSPTPPDGWRVAFIGDTEDGPQAWCVRPLGVSRETVAGEG